MSYKSIESGYKGSGTYILNALKKYGPEAFKRINISLFETKEEAYFWEGFYIKLYKTETKYGGYN